MTGCLILNSFVKGVEKTGSEGDMSVMWVWATTAVVVVVKELAEMCLHTIVREEKPVPVIALPELRARAV